MFCLMTFNDVRLQDQTCSLNFAPGQRVVHIFYLKFLKSSNPNALRGEGGGLSNHPNALRGESEGPSSNPYAQ